MMNRFRLGIALLLCGMAGGSFAADIGWIESVDGNVAGVRLVRDGKNETVRPYQTVQAGDVVHLPDEATILVITLSDGRALRVAYKQSPFRIDGHGAAPSVKGNLLKWVSGLLGGESHKEGPQRLTAMTARNQESSPLTVPYMTKRFYLAAKARPLYFSWSGGCAPFQLRLTRLSDHREIVLLKAIESREVLTPVIDLQEGDYQLDVADASGSVYEDQLRVVPVGQIPVFPESLQSLPPATANLVFASWLAKAEAGLWVIEAMQQLKALSNTSSTAKAALRQLEQGGAGSQE